MSLRHPNFSAWTIALVPRLFALLPAALSPAFRPATGGAFSPLSDFYELSTSSVQQPGQTGFVVSRERTGEVVRPTTGTFLPLPFHPELTLQKMYHCYFEKDVFPVLAAIHPVVSCCCVHVYNVNTDDRLLNHAFLFYLSTPCRPVIGPFRSCDRKCELPPVPLALSKSHLPPAPLRGLTRLHSSCVTLPNRPEDARSPYPGGGGWGGAPAPQPCPTTLLSGLKLPVVLQVYDRDASILCPISQRVESSFIHRARVLHSLE